MKPLSATRRGVALIITLAFVVLVTILVVGLNGLMTVERPAANSHFEKTRAAQYAQQGVEQVVAKLDQNIADPALCWISQPGQLTVSTPPTGGGSAFTVPVTEIALSSGYPMSSLSATVPAYLQAPDLNLTTLQDPGKHLITERKDPNTGQTVKMPVRWIYVRQNGDADPSETPVSSAGNPVVGRYAYWTDDESCKINDNLAWGRSAANKAPAGSATRLELTALQDSTDTAANLTAPIADAIHAFITKDDYKTLENDFFNSPKDARQVSVNGRASGAAAPLEKYKFEVTHYNHDPDTTFFNEPRIVLTTRPDRAGWTYDTTSTPPKWVGKNKKSGIDGTPHYIRILASEGTPADYPDPTAIPPQSGKLDPGVPGNLDSAATTDTINFLIKYLKRNDWPMLGPGGSQASFQDKYYSAYPVANRAYRLVQLAIDIIDYVRAAESPLPVAPPLRATVSGSSNGILSFTLGAPTVNNNQYLDSYIGSSRMPFITEVGIWYEPKDPSATGVPQYQQHFLVEIHSPKHYNIPDVQINTLTLGIDTAGPPLSTLFRGAISTTDIVGVATKIKSGDYVTIDHKYGAVREIAAAKFPAAAQRLRVYLGTTDGLTDIAPLAQDDATNQYLRVPVDKPPTKSRDKVSSIETDDPRINSHMLTWTSQIDPADTTDPKPPPPPLTEKNTFAGISGTGLNACSTLGNTPGTPAGAIHSAQQDTDANGTISDAAFYMPAPAGSTLNVLGCVGSVGELGYVHTGIESNNLARKDPVDPKSTLIPLPKGIPWRSLRLQPNNYPDTTTVPDWALMDLFAAPNIVYANAKAVTAPHDSAVGGRVNLNSVAVPFDTADNSTGPKLTRTLPLAAVLLGCTSLAYKTPGLTFAQAQDIVSHIYHSPPDLAPLKNGSTGKAYGASGAPVATFKFISPGEVVEIQGVADGGEESEELVRQISSLVTVRGGVFSVYTVGQAIKQTAAGALLVTGEQRVQAMLERYVPGQPPNTVKFRPVYYRNLIP